MVPCAEEHHTVARHSGVTTSLSQILGSMQKKLPLMALSTVMAESFKELDTESSLA